MDSGVDFKFPYPPYSEQIKLMEGIYECIESSSVGCFESPTGTGKSLSAICASFTWLLKEENNVLQKSSGGIGEVSSSETGDWLSDMLNCKTAGRGGESKNSPELRTKHDENIKRIAESNVKSKPAGMNNFFRKTVSPTVARDDSEPIDTSTKVDDDEFAMKHYDSEEEQRKRLSAALESDDSDSDSEQHGRRGWNCPPAKSVMNQLSLPQIYYCSRTHSQLAQFVAEMKKTAFLKPDPITGVVRIRCVTLGSRRNLCINSAVTRLKAESSMAEACLDMQQASSKVTKVADPSSSSGSKKAKLRQPANSKCAYHSRAAERSLADRILGQLRDIEDSVTLGHDVAACPYYASRAALQYANVVCLPYNMLLSREMRESLGIDLTGKVVIVDEAHNLIETINQLHSAELSVTQIDAAVAAIAAYSRRYQTQLSGKNLYYVNLLTAVLGKLRKVLCPKPSKVTLVPKAQPTSVSPPAVAEGGTQTGTSSTTTPPPATPATATPSSAAAVRPPTSATLTVNDFLFKSDLDGVNLFKLKRHVTETNLVNKIGGFAEAQARQNANSIGTVQIHRHGSSTGSGRTDVTAALRCALELLVCLTNLEGDGRVFLLNVTTTGAAAVPTAIGSSNQSAVPPASVKFVMLNPSVHFAPIVAQARSLVLLGGTMQPFSYFTSVLFPTIPRPQLRVLSCQHVVPASQVGAVVVPHAESVGGTGGRRVTFEFTYDKRLNLDMTNALFYALVEVCANTPGGVVVFCTSFQYLDALLARWRSSKLLPKLDAIKRVFAESRVSGSGDSSTENSTSGDCVWEGYKHQLEAHPEEGALLFSVINGKLSEGINFSDALARCVVVVGLPYPDVRDPVLQEKMRYVAAVEAAGGPAGSTISPVSTTAVASRTTVTGMGPAGTVTAAGRRLCESMCMKAVNQSIGRAIRHARDYASVVLLDRRYQQDQLRTQLPGWILRSLQVCASSGDGGSGTARLGEEGGPLLGARLKAFFAAQKG